MNFWLEENPFIDSFLLTQKERKLKLNLENLTQKWKKDF